MSKYELNPLSPTGYPLRLRDKEEPLPDPNSDWPEEEVEEERFRLGAPRLDGSKDTRLKPSDPNWQTVNRVDGEKYIYADRNDPDAIDPKPKPQPVTARMGFIAPNGDFYPCAYCAHHALGYVLAPHVTTTEDRKGTWGNGDDALHNAGWLSLRGGGIIHDGFSFTNRKPWTDAQKDTVRALIAAFSKAIDDGVTFGVTLVMNPEGYEYTRSYSHPWHDALGRTVDDPNGDDSSIAHYRYCLNKMQTSLDMETGDYEAGAAPLVDPLDDAAAQAASAVQTPTMRRFRRADGTPDGD